MHDSPCVWSSALDGSVDSQGLSQTHRIGGPAIVLYQMCRGPECAVLASESWHQPQTLLDL